MSMQSDKKQDTTYLENGQKYGEKMNKLRSLGLYKYQIKMDVSNVTCTCVTKM